MSVSVVASSALSVPIHFKVIRFVTECGLKLRMRSVVLATACTLYHRFYRRHVPSQFDPFLVGTTCIYLAGKVEEDHLKLRDIINVAHRTLHPDEPLLTIGTEYQKIRESIVHCELFVMRVLQFRVICDHPHKYLLHYLRSLQHWLPPDVWKKVPIADTAWAVLRDSYHDNLCLRYRPQHLSLAALYLSLASHEVQVPYTNDCEVPWYQAFADDCNFTLLEEIVSHLIELYQLEDTVFPSVQNALEKNEASSKIVIVD